MFKKLLGCHNSMIRSVFVPRSSTKAGCYNILSGVISISFYTSKGSRKNNQFTETNDVKRIFCTRTNLSQGLKIKGQDCQGEKGSARHLNCEVCMSWKIKELLLNITGLRKTEKTSQSSLDKHKKRVIKYNLITPEY